VKQVAADDMGKLEKTGITILTPDVGPFRAAVEPANEAYAASLGGKAQELFAKAKAIGRR
jgi:TRAP-type C4-dicarboxylate transport system substrate-binding protein